MHEYEEMLDFVKSQLELVKPRGNAGKLRIKYNRFHHIERVYAWMKRIVAELSPEISVSEKELHIATIFHDAGHGIVEDRSSHAAFSAQICRNYLQNKGFEEQFIAKVEFLVANHSKKELLASHNTPIELIILMEADLLDDTGALGMVMDTMIESKLEDATYQKILEHIEMYTAKDMKENPMVTLPAKRIWKEKQDLTDEFIRQFRRDINI